MAIPEVRREILRRIEEDPGLLSQNAFGALFLETTSADARSGVELQNNMLEKYLQILFKVYGEYGGGFGTDSLYRRGYHRLLPIDILNSFANTPVTLTAIVKKLIRECVASPWSYYYLPSETLIAILVQVNKEMDEAHSGVVAELLNDFYSVRGSVSEIVGNNNYLELKFPLQNSAIDLALFEEIFEQTIGTFIELDDERLDTAIGIFSPVIKRFAFKTTQRLLVHNDVRVQNRILRILTQENLVESWWMFLAESGSPTLMHFVHSYVIDIKSDELFSQKLLDLFDSSVRATRDLAFKILSDAQDRVNLNELVQKLAEHPAPDVWSFVLRYYSDLQQKHSKSSLVQSVLLSRRVARHIKSDLMNLIEDDPERQIASPYLSRLSLSKTQLDNEFALKFMAQNPEYFDDVVVEEVWRDS